MKAQPQPAETRGQPVRRPARPIRPAVPPDGLHRYTPVPPAYRDADGYLVEDGMECWLFDPAGFKLATPLVGYRLRARRYQQIGADAAGRLHSKVLGLDLHVHAGELRFRDPATRKDLRTYDESEDRGDAEQDRADAAERERAAEKERADAVERERAAEKERADVAERQLATAERELARLRQRLGDS